MENLEKIEMQKIVPIVAMISAGKTKLLNTILNLKFLMSSSGKGTKFVNILRYNPNIPKPIFYHLLVKKNEKGSYEFFKDLSKEVYEGNEKIEEANITINQKLREEVQINYEDIFYMTEFNNAEHMEESNKSYFLTHWLCDIPGVSESSNDKKEPEKKMKKIKFLNQLQ